MPKNFRIETPRATTVVRCHCHAAPELFLPWEMLSKSAKAEFGENGGIPCEGDGMPGEWCSGCRFGAIDEPGEIFIFAPHH